MDARLNDAGYLRLMTSDPLVRHMGNTVPPEARSEADRLQAAGAPAGRRARRLLEWGPLRRLLLAIHNQIFRWYFRG